MHYKQPGERVNRRAFPQGFRDSDRLHGKPDVRFGNVSFCKEFLGGPNQRGRRNSDRFSTEESARYHSQGLAVRAE